MKLRNYLLLLILFTISSLKSFAAQNYDYQRIDGIEYHIEKKGIGSNYYYIATIIDAEMPSTSTKITIPSKVKAKWYDIVNTNLYEITIEAKVVAISESETNNTFNGLGNNTNVKVVELPSTLKTITGNIFKGLTSLNTIFVDKDNPYFCSKEGALYSKDTTFLIKVPCACQKMYIDPSTTSIGGYAFYGTQIKEIHLSKNISFIGEWAFTATPNLKSFEIDSDNPYYVTDGMAILTKDQKKLVALNSNRNFYNIPQTVEECSKGAICYNKKIQVLVLPYVLEKIPDFTNCTNLMNIFSFQKIDYDKLPKGVCLFMPSTYIEEKESKNYKIIPFVEIDNTQSKITLSSHNISPITLTQATIGKDTKKSDEDNELISFSNLSPSKQYNSEISFIFKPFTMGGQYTITGSFPITTLKPELDIKLQKVTNTTLSVKGVCEGDMKVIKHNIDDEEGQDVTIRSLAPGRNVIVTYSIITDDGSSFSTSKEFQTKEIELMITASKGSTSCVLSGSYKNTDATIIHSGFYESNSDVLKLTGLDPNTQYSRTYYVTTEEGGTISKTVNFKTKNLELTTLQPKGVNTTSSVVSAKTNIDEEETNVGFQWRKYDAPSSLKSSEGYAPIYNGVLEGFIKNLQPSSYYNVRAFYKSKVGKYYYGDWVTFDPSDFSFFEPTVHTYAKISIENNTAQVRGVALQGSDDILEQGFEYWMENEAKSRSTNAVQKVLATGQNMEAELTNLAYNTTYYCHAYVKTEKTTTYGETQQFTTPKQETSGISNITSDAHEDLNFAVRQDDGLRISISGNNEIYSYRITNINGSQVAQGKVLANNDWHHITKQRLPNGIYIIVVTNNKQMKIKKVAIK